MNNHKGLPGLVLITFAFCHIGQALETNVNRQDDNIVIQNYDGMIRGIEPVPIGDSQIAIIGLHDGLEIYDLVNRKSTKYDCSGYTFAFDDTGKRVCVIRDMGADGNFGFDILDLNSRKILCSGNGNGKVSRLVYANTFYLVSNEGLCFSINLSDGKLERVFGNTDNISDIAYDMETKLILVSSPTKLCVYNSINGKFVYEIKHGSEGELLSIAIINGAILCVDSKAVLYSTTIRNDKALTRTALSQRPFTMARIVNGRHVVYVQERICGILTIADAVKTKREIENISLLYDIRSIWYSEKCKCLLFVGLDNRSEKGFLESRYFK